MAKSSIQLVIFNSNVKLPEGILNALPPLPRSEKIPRLRLFSKVFRRFDFRPLLEFLVLSCGLFQPTKNGLIVWFKFKGPLQMVGRLATGEWERFHICLEGQSLIVFLLVNIFSNAVRTPASETWCWRVSRTFVKAFNSGSVCSSQKPIKNTRKRNVKMDLLGLQVSSSN